MHVGRWTLAGVLGHGRLGTLHLARDEEGALACVRGLDSRRVAAEATREQVLDLVRRLTGGDHPGLVPILDLVIVGDAWYLVTERQAGPPLAALLAASAHAGRLGAWGGDPATAAAVLVDTGRACLDLHAAGLGHGSLSAGEVLCGGDARARLSDPGLLRILTGGPLEPAADARAFAGLALEMRRAWVPTGHPFAAALDRAIRLAAPDTGEPDLGRAVDAVEGAAGDLTPGWEDRGRLRRAVDAWTSTQPRLEGVTLPARAPAAAAAATIVDAPAAAPRRQAESEAATAVDPLAPAATVVDPALTAAPASPADEIRIGEPPRAAAAGAPPGRGGAERAATPPRWPEASRRRRRGLAIAATVGGLAVLGLLLALGLGRLTTTRPLQVLSVRAAAASAQVGCGKQAVVNGVIGTNGGAGTLTYEWSRSDGIPTGGRQTEAVPAGTTSIPVLFTLTVTGRGSLHEVISLSVLGPTPLGPFPAAIDYRC
jgi:hypothetical protein